MKTIMRPLGELAGFEEAAHLIRDGQTPVCVDGCVDAQKCQLIRAFGEDDSLKLVITYDEKRARQICEEYRFYDKNVYFYPAKDIIFYSADVHSDLIVKERLQAMRPILDEAPAVIVTTPDALMDRVLPLEVLDRFRVELAPGNRIMLSDFSSLLTEMGFERCGQVSAPGQFSIRGGILDFFNYADPAPYRIELWDDEIDSIRTFDPESQRSIEPADRAVIYPAGEYLFTKKVTAAGLHKIDLALKDQVEALSSQRKANEAAHLRQVIAVFKEEMESGSTDVGVDSYIPFFFEDTVSFLDYFKEDNCLVFVDEPARTADRARQAWEEFTSTMQVRLEQGYILPLQMQTFMDGSRILARTAAMQTIYLSTLMWSSSDIFPVKSRVSIPAVSMRTYRRDFALLVKDLTAWIRKKYRILLIARSSLRGRQLCDDLEREGLNVFYTEDDEHELQAGQVMIIHGSLTRGFEYEQIRFAVIAESDIFGQEKKRRKSRRTSDGARAALDFSSLTVGDYVVHEKYGIGIYRGIEKLELDGVLQDYVKIEYADGGSLYIQPTHLDLIQKYAGKEAEHVKVSSMGGTRWNKTKSKVKKSVAGLARDLVRLYAVRENSKGFACGPDTVWQTEFEEMFPFEETADQLDAIAAVKKDMESTKIMDRLICGDVGFGKTEVAIRAAFKMVQEGRQVAVLVPTTILAQQHYNTFLQRMAAYPVKIAQLSRFVTAAEQKKTISGLESGSVDIVIGTHRLLSKDVKFRNLGLLVVDEEQRFGVDHKEKIKKLKNTVDVLTLTATPIPRTMHMSLIGIRDISLLEQAPVDRVPIQTYVMEYSREMVREAISRELQRGGQVYYVYNRTDDIDRTAADIQAMFPDAEVAYAHGQMAERDLEKVMYSFVNGQIDVLVSTTIIETGLDIANVNTIIVSNADRFGLAQLYQLRGRVGRSDRTAYAYLMYQRDRVLKETAMKRLSAIREFTALGSGYRIALRDLEIRGAGNLLGKVQSGDMEAVGYDLYCKLLAAAVRQEKGEEPEEEFETRIEISIDAFIPDTYIMNESQKLEMYKRISCIGSDADYSELLDEMIDRYGDLPAPAENLLLTARVKMKAQKLKIRTVKAEGRDVRLIHPELDISQKTASGLSGKYPRRVRFSTSGQPVVTFRTGAASDREMLEETAAFLDTLAGLTKEKSS